MPGTRRSAAAPVTDAGATTTTPPITDTDDGENDVTGGVSQPASGGERGQDGPPKPGRAIDYGHTRLTNFRLPVDLHDRYRRLIQDVERKHPKLRHPSLTELVIALLEEGPDDVDAAAQLIHRKRVAQHQIEGLS